MGFREECGVFGVFGDVDAAVLTALGLHSLQHRGQEAAGIVSFNGGFHVEKSMGLVGDHFNRQFVISRLEGQSAIGHNRYSTAGDDSVQNIQPMLAEYANGGIAIAHNGNLTNQDQLREQLIAEGSIFQSNSDTELFLHLMARSLKTSIVERFIDALQQAEGAFSVVALTEHQLIGARDPNGFRPLVLGRRGDAYFFSSETCAFDITDAEYVRDVEPGEVVVITQDGVESIKYATESKHFCIFEFVYFSRPDSRIENQNVHHVRKSIGHRLAHECQLDGDIVVPVPDSGVPAALGYAEYTGIPFDLGITRNHYVGRTFIEPEDEIRHLGVKMKHNANASVLNGKRVILVDDSVVRGTTSKKIVQMVRAAGATEVHLVIASPPTVNSCYYGVDTPTREQLLAANHIVEEMRDMIGADSLYFLSLDGLHLAVGVDGVCDACFSNQYPTKIDMK